MPSRYIDIPSRDGDPFAVYFTAPPGKVSPGVVVIQEIFGINPVIRAVAEGLAARGYAVAVPDLFWRQEPGVEITDRSEEEWKRAFELYEGLDEARAVEDLAITLRWLRERDECTGASSTLGFCLGGKLAYLAACRLDIEASVGYYGVGIEQALGEARMIRGPLLLHVAEKDSFCPPEAQKEIREALADHPKVTIETYPGCDHAFARPGGEHYDREAALLAEERTLAHLARWLAPNPPPLSVARPQEGGDGEDGTDTEETRT